MNLEFFFSRYMEMSSGRNIFLTLPYVETDLAVCRSIIQSFRVLNFP